MYTFIDNDHICKVYEYVENTESKQNFISMELLGKLLILILQLK